MVESGLVVAGLFCWFMGVEENVQSERNELPPDFSLLVSLGSPPVLSYDIYIPGSLFFVFCDMDKRLVY